MTSIEGESNKELFQKLALPTLFSVSLLLTSCSVVQGTTAVSITDSTVTITQEGAYLPTGTPTDGQIVVATLWVAVGIHRVLWAVSEAVHRPPQATA